ncbi:MAG: AAA family ATPase [Clostridia bacterium]|nr:AAA family ATPase [Clostridia bacterium]
MGKSYVIASGNGGAGKSMFAVNLAYLLSEKGFKTILIDMDTGMRTLDLYLGLQNNIVYDLDDVLSGRCRIRQGIVKYSENLYLMAAAPVKLSADSNEQSFLNLIEKLKNSFDYIIMDGPKGRSVEFAAKGADEALILSCGDYASNRNADSISKFLHEKGVDKQYLIFNKISKKLIAQEFAPRIEQLMNYIKVKPIGIIQYDENITVSTNLGVPIVCKKGTYIRRAFESILKELL